MKPPVEINPVRAWSPPDYSTNLERWSRWMLANTFEAAPVFWWFLILIFMPAAFYVWR